MFPSNIIVHGNVKIPKGFKEIEFGACNSNWVPDGYSLLVNIDNVQWVEGSSLIVCTQGTYNEYFYSGCDLSLKEMYDELRDERVYRLVFDVVNDIKSSIEAKKTLPFYINNINLAGAEQECLADELKERHGVIVSFHPNGLIVHDLV